MIFPDDEYKLIKVLQYLNNNNFKYYVIGRGSNLLANDCGYDGIVVNTSKIDYIHLKDEYTIECGAGTALNKVCAFALNNSLTGLEFAFGIPGSVGGAVYMNAGAYGGEIKDIIISSRHINSEKQIETFSADSISLSYRHSAYSDNNYIITGASFRLSKGNKEEIKNTMHELSEKRKSKQPLEFPSAGSTFKRPQGYYAGALIEECGLKGFKIGGAQVSEKHAGFIINCGGATCNDILALIKHCQDTVFRIKGVKLETEVKLIS